MLFTLHLSTATISVPSTSTVPHVRSTMSLVEIFVVIGAAECSELDWTQVNLAAACSRKSAREHKSCSCSCVRSKQHRFWHSLAVQTPTMSTGAGFGAPTASLVYLR